MGVYRAPVAKESPYPYVGIIKTFNPTKKYGFINIAYKQDLFFHQKNSKLNDPKELLFVAFKVRKSPVTGKTEAYDVDYIANYKDELLAHQENLLSNDLYYLYYCCPQLMKDISIDMNKHEIDLLSRLDEYVNNININVVAESYEIKVVSGHIYKPGDDDSAWISYEGDRSKYVYMLQVQRKDGTYSMMLRDIYLDSLLPRYNEVICHDRGFCPWEKMLSSFGDLENYQPEARKKTLEIREKAVSLYSSVDHKRVLQKFLMEKIKKDSNDFYNKIERTINDSLAYTYCLNYRISLAEYIN